MDREFDRIAEIDEGRRAGRVLDMLRPYIEAYQERLMTYFKEAPLDNPEHLQLIKLKYDAVASVMLDIEDIQLTGQMAEQEQLQ